MALWTAAPAELSAAAMEAGYREARAASTIDPESALAWVNWTAQVDAASPGQRSDHTSRNNDGRSMWTMLAVFVSVWTVVVGRGIARTRAGREH